MIMLYMLISVVVVCEHRTLPQLQAVNRSVSTFTLLTVQFGMFCVYTGGLLPAHVCVQGGASAQFKCPVMDDRMVFLRLTPHVDAGGFVRDFTTSPLPAKRMFSHRTSTFLVKATKDDQGLYAAVLNNTLSTMTCVTYLSVVTVKDGCTRKVEHLELIVKNSSKSVQRGGNLTLKSTVYRNGLPYPDSLVHFAYWDVTNQSTAVQLTNKEGRVRGGTTSQLHLRNIPCTLTDILVLASTKSASAKEYVHITFEGQLTIERNLPAKVHKKVGERLSLTAEFRSPSCRQARITWKRSGDKLVTFSAEKPSGNSTVANRRGLVSYDFHPDSGIITTSLILYGVNLVDSEVYSAEVQVGEESVTAKTNFIVSDTTSQAILPSTLRVDDGPLIRSAQPSVTSRPQVLTGPPTPREQSDKDSPWLWITIGLSFFVAITLTIIVAVQCQRRHHRFSGKRGSSFENPKLDCSRTSHNGHHHSRPPGTVDCQDTELYDIGTECAFYEPEVKRFANFLLRDCNMNGDAFLSSLDTHAFTSPRDKTHAVLKYWIDAKPHRYGSELKVVLEKMEKGSVIGRHEAYFNGCESQASKKEPTQEGEVARKERPADAERTARLNRMDDTVATKARLKKNGFVATRAVLKSV